MKMRREECSTHGANTKYSMGRILITKPEWKITEALLIAPH
jgi:hypothetical protein